MQDLKMEDNSYEGKYLYYFKAHESVSEGCVNLG